MHLPVLQKEAIRYLEPKSNENFIDATFGEGGHGLKILEVIKPQGKLLGIEIDPELYEITKKRLEQENPRIFERLILVNDSYLNLPRIIEEYQFRPVHGVLFDLGMSLWHIKESKRGFSFQRDEPLDMRFNPQANRLTAFEIVNYWEKEKIEKILREYGEEKFAKKIAENIEETRRIKPIRTTFDLIKIIQESIPLALQRKLKIHPATRTFQAFRIAVNRELSTLEETLSFLPKILDKGAKIVVISFHSLEDRIVKKKFLEAKEKGLLKILTKKPVVPAKEEIILNPSSRSAKLRAAQII